MWKYFMQITEVSALDYNWNIICICLDNAILFQFSQMLILLMVQASNNAANWKIMTKVNSISYWLSLAQLKTNAAFFFAFRMHSLSHKSLFHGSYRLRRLTAFLFVSLIPKTNPWFVVSDATKRQKRKMWYQRSFRWQLYLIRMQSARGLRFERLNRS